jgi:hypothetical protein
MIGDIAKGTGVHAKFAADTFAVSITTRAVFIAEIARPDRLSCRKAPHIADT